MQDKDFDNAHTPVKKKKGQLNVFDLRRVSALQNPYLSVYNKKWRRFRIVVQKLTANKPKNFIIITE